ncbi:hypothetical protein [Edaphobacter aggregans]|uniref:hypothetical protein n=1 Tax=Edaphobacter aggregans TaxID=570835 RepID=UPI0005517B5C|nr:hypothetical protein [Edaphobacter aggregans]
MAIAVIIACALAVVNTSMWAAANNNKFKDKEKACSNRTLDGDYGFTIEGLLGIPGPGIQVRGVVLQHYDGNGNITQVDHVVIGGMVPPEEWRPGTGTYTVNPDCTGKATLFPGGTSGPPLVLFFVIVKHGEMIRQVVDGNATIATGNKLD